MSTVRPHFSISSLMLEITAGLAMGYLMAGSSRQETRQHSARLDIDSHANEGSPELVAFNRYQAVEFDMVPRGCFACQVNVWEVFFLK
jgi:hypothetical protein